MKLSGSNIFSSKHERSHMRLSYSIQYNTTQTVRIKNNGFTFQQVKKLLFNY